MFKLKMKLGTQITVVMIALLSVVVVTMSGVLCLDFTKRYKISLQSNAIVVAKGLEHEILENITEFSSELSKEISDICIDVINQHEIATYALIMNQQGEIIGHSNKGWLGKMRDQALFENVKSATSGSPVIQKALFSGREHFDITLPLSESNNGVQGFVSVGLSVDKVFRPIKEAASLVLAIFAFALILIMLVSYYFGTRVTAPLNRLIELLKEFGTGEGDLTKRMDIETNDEIGEIGHWFDIFVGNTQVMVKTLKDTTTKLNEDVMKISGSSARIKSSAESQNGTVGQTASSFVDIKDSFYETSTNINNLSSATDEASSSILELIASVGEVANIVEEVSSSVENAASSIEEMTISTKEVAGIAEELSGSADTTVASIAQITASINEVEKSTRDAMNVAVETATDAEKGMTVVEKTIGGMRKIKLSVNETGEIIKKLEEKSSDIGEILTVIEDVAEQTSLLALNAAIIAAQAGEHGRGVAVVAEEIKDLSERTASSTKEISSLIKSVQQESNNAYKSMDIASKSVSEGVELSQEAGNSLEKILQSALTSKEMTSKISSATAEQLKGSQQVSEAMENVNNLVMRVASATQEQHKGSAQIFDATEVMKAGINHVMKASREQSIGGQQVAMAIENIKNMMTFVNSSCHDQSNRVQLMFDSLEEIKKQAGEYTQVVSGMNETVDSMISKTEVLSHEVDSFKV